MSTSLIAVDIGNSFLHVARYSLDKRDEFALPALIPWFGAIEAEVLRTAAIQPSWLQQLPAVAQSWFVVSVNRQREAQLASAIRRHRPDDHYQVLTYRDFGLTVDVEAPERVGSDRIAAACAAFQLRRQTGSVIVIDAGTAITVDRVDEPGIFRGGAIFPGPYLMGDSLHRHTDALPFVAAPAAPPCPVGKNTVSAIASGLFWGTVGALRELIERMRAEMKAPPELFFTSGADQQVISSLVEATAIPDLVLRGVALAGCRILQPKGSSRAPESP